MSTESVGQFEALVASRMKRFNIILEKAQFQFKQYQHDGVEWCVNNELRPNPVVIFVVDSSLMKWVLEKRL